MKGFTLYKQQDLSQSISSITTEKEVKEYWEILYFKKENSESYIHWNKQIDYSTNDKMVLGWNVKFEKEFLLPDGNSTTDTMTVKVYPINLFERNITATDTNDLISQMQGVETPNLDLGSRRVVAIETGASFDIYYYYELNSGSAAADDINVIIPDDISTNPSYQRKWDLVKTYSKLRADTTYSITMFDYIGLNFFPNGADIPEEVITYNTNDILNKVDYKKEINLFDLDNNFNNDEKIFLNYTKIADGTPTTVWSELGEDTVTKTLQSWLVGWIQRLTKKTRMVVSGTFFTDREFTPINVLNDPDDFNRVFYPNGISSNVKARQYNGEVIEIGSDNVPSDTAFDAAHQQIQHD